MEEPIVIELFKKLFKPLIKLLGYILCFPQLLLKGAKLNIVKNYQCNNIIEILFTTIFLFFYNFIYLNFHLIYFLKNFSLVESKFELFVAFIIFYSFTATFYYAEDIRFFILKDLGFLVILVINIFEYCFIVLSFFVRLDKQSFNLIFAKNYDINLYNFTNFAMVNIFIYFFETVFIIFLNALIILHAINPLSLLRIPMIIKQRNLDEEPSTVISSFIFIIGDFVILLIHLLNFPFIFSFIKNTLEVISSVFIPLNKLNWDVRQAFALGMHPHFNKFFHGEGYRRYNYNVNLIINSFLTNYNFIIEFVKKYVKPIIFAGKVLKYAQLILKYLFVLIFSAINLMFFWRIKQLLYNQSKFKQEKNLIEFARSSMKLNLSGVTDILFLFVFALNRINVFNYFFIGLYEKNLIKFTERNFNKILIGGKKPSNEKLFKDITSKEVFSIIKLFRQEKFLDVFYTDKFQMIKIINFDVFLLKSNDFIFSLISIINFFSPTFYIKLYNYLKFKKIYNRVDLVNKDKIDNSIVSNFINNFYLFPLLSVDFYEKLQERFEKDFEKQTFAKISKLETENNFIEEYLECCNSPLFELSRKIIFRNVSIDFVFGLLLVLNLITVLDPFSGLIHILNIFKFLGRIKMSLSKLNNRNNNTKDCFYAKISSIIVEEIKISVKVFYEFLLNVCIRLPLILLSIILFPFNLFKAFLFCFENNYAYFYRKIKQNNQLSLRENLNEDQKAFINYYNFLKESGEEINNLINFRNNEFVKSVFTQLIKGWAILIKFLLIQLSLIRAIYLYYDLISLKKFYNFFKKFISKIDKTEEFLAYINFINIENDNKSIYEEESNYNADNILNRVNNNIIRRRSNSFVNDNYSEIKLLRMINSSKKYFSNKNIFIFYDYESWLQFFSQFFLKKNSACTNTTNSISEIDIVSLKKLFNDKITYFAYLEGVIDDNFNQLMKEILFYPFIIFAFLTNPIVFYFGFLSLKSNDYNFFRQRKLNFKFKICISICLEYLKIFFNICKIMFLTISLVKFPDLITIFYYYSRTLFSKNRDCSFKCLLDEHYEGEFSKDLNTLVLQALNFYFVTALILVNFLLILRIPSVARRVGRFVKVYLNNLKLKYFGKKLNKKEKVSPLEVIKINCFANICEFLKPKEIGKVLLLNINISKRTEKKLIWDNLFVNFYLKKINKFFKFLEIKEKYSQISNLESLNFTYLINEDDEAHVKQEKQNNKKKGEEEKTALLNSINAKEFTSLSAKFVDKNLQVENLKTILKDFESMHFDSKVLCQKAQNSFDSNLEIPEKLHDKFLGLTNVLIEETFESIFKSPHLILLPFKLLSIPLILIAYLHVSFYFATFGRPDSLITRKSILLAYDKFTAGNYFYNIQLNGLFSLFLIIFVQISVILKILDGIYRFVLRVLSLKWLLRTKVSFEYDNDGSLVIKRYENNPPYGVLDHVENDSLSTKDLLTLTAGHCITLLVLCLHLTMALLPTIYFKSEGISNILHKAFFDVHRLENHSISRAGGSPFYSALNWWIFSEEIFNALWKMSISKIFYLIVGNYFINLVSFIASLSMYFYYCVEMRTQLDVYPYYAVLIVWLDVLMKCIFSFEFIYSIIYPHIFLFKIYKFIARKIKILNSTVLLNLVSFIVVIFPFYFNFTLKFSLFRFITINTWAVTSFMRIGKLTKNLNYN